MGAHFPFFPEAIIWLESGASLALDGQAVEPQLAPRAAPPVGTGTPGGM